MSITKEEILEIVDKTATTELQLIDWIYDDHLDPQTNLINFIHSYARYRYHEGYDDASEFLTSGLN